MKLKPNHFKHPNSQKNQEIMNVYKTANQQLLRSVVRDSTASMTHRRQYERNGLYKRQSLQEGENHITIKERLRISLESETSKLASSLYSNVIADKQIKNQSDKEDERYLRIIEGNHQEETDDNFNEEVILRSQVQDQSSVTSFPNRYQNNQFSPSTTGFSINHSRGNNLLNRSSREGNLINNHPYSQLNQKFYRLGSSRGYDNTNMSMMRIDEKLPPPTRGGQHFLNNTNPLPMNPNQTMTFL